MAVISSAVATPELAITNAGSDLRQSGGRTSHRPHFPSSVTGIPTTLSLDSKPWRTRNLWPESPHWTIRHPPRSAGSSARARRAAGSASGERPGAPFRPLPRTSAKGASAVELNVSVKSRLMSRLLLGVRKGSSIGWARLRLWLGSF